MKGRFEGHTKNGIAVFAAISFFCIMSTGKMNGQNLPDAITQLLELEVEEGGSDIESLVEYYEKLLESPLKINRADREELERLSLLSEFQIVSLLEYREEFGEILSKQELALVDGFNERIVANLSPFLSFDMTNDIASVKKDSFRNSLLLRGKRTFDSSKDEENKSGIPYSLLSKYKIRYGERFQAGATIENDPFETKVPDYLSLHLQAKEIALGRGVVIRSAVAGDFSARMGQGLVLWNSFSMSALGAPSSIIKKESPILPYTSSDESNGLRGAGVTIDVGDNWRASILFSRRGVDAKSDDTYYYSIQSTGYHDTEGTLEGRKSMNETVVGANVSHSWRRVKVGATAALYTFDKRNGVEIKEYNMFRQYDGWWGNASMDLYAVLGGLRLFSEVALDFGAAPALIAGVIYPFSSVLELSLLYRYYSKEHIARHSGGFSSTSQQANENGFLLNTRWSISSKSVLSTYSDFVYHPWSRFQISGSSKKLKHRMQLDLKLNAVSSLYLRIVYSWSDNPMVHKGSVRINYAHALPSGFGFSARGELSMLGQNSADFGYLLHADASFKSSSKKLDCAVRGAVFHVDEWDNRIYSYERDLPQSFSVPALYGRGLSGYCYLRVKPLRCLDICAKFSYVKYFDKERDVSQAKLQLSLTF